MQFQFKKHRWGALTVALLLSACGGGSGIYTPPLLGGSGGNVGGGIGNAGGNWTTPSNPCQPGIPQDGLVVTESFSGVDGQNGGGGIFPTGTSTLTFTFNGGTLTTMSSNPNYYLFPSETYDQTTGAILVSTPPSSALGPGGVHIPGNIDSTNVDASSPNPASFVGYYPSDWAQQLGTTLGTQPVGATAQLAVMVEARGVLPNLLAGALYGQAADPANILQLNTTVTATRLADSVVGGVPACNFSFTMYRPFMWSNPNDLFTAVYGVTPDFPVSLAVGTAAANAYNLLGPGLAPFATLDNKIAIEPYIPAMQGTFSTSNQKPFLPMALDIKHVYGVSSMADPTYDWTKTDNTVAMGSAKALRPAAPAAEQTYSYIGP